jgi:hypothetical protein
LRLSLLLLAACAIVLLLLLVWILGGSRKAGKRRASLLSGEEFGRRHVTFFPQVQRALAREDLAYLTSRGTMELSRRVRRERKKIVLAYLSFLRSDFLKLWRLARVIASLSPKVGAAQELQRLQLGLVFFVRYELLRFKFRFGFTPIPELGALSDYVSNLAIRLETAMNELGERAALASKLASSLDGRNLDAP